MIEFPDLPRGPVDMSHVVWDKADYCHQLPFKSFPGSCSPLAVLPKPIVDVCSRRELVSQEDKEQKGTKKGKERQTLRSFRDCVWMVTIEGGEESLSPFSLSFTVFYRAR